MGSGVSEQRVGWTWTSQEVREKEVVGYSECGGWMMPYSECGGGVVSYSECEEGLSFSLAISTLDCLLNFQAEMAVCCLSLELRGKYSIIECPGEVG